MDNQHSCEAIVITCIDYRFQEYIDTWIDQHFQPQTYDRVAFAGGVLNSEAVLKQIEIAHKLHHIKKVVLINHEDCGAYGAGGTLKKHVQDLTEAKHKIKEKYPGLEIETYYLHLDGTFEKVTDKQIFNKPQSPLSALLTSIKKVKGILPSGLVNSFII